MNKLLGVIFGIFVIFVMIMNTNSASKTTIESNLDLASLVSMNIADAGEVDGCDTDPNDKCWNSETGVCTIDCDPSIWWDTCSN